MQEILKRLRKNTTEEANFHRAVRRANRAKTAAQKARDARTHQLCNIGGAILKFYPDLADLYPDELETLFDAIFTFDPAIDAIVRSAIQNKKSNIGKEA